MPGDEEEFKAYHIEEGLGRDGDWDCWAL